MPKCLFISRPWWSVVVWMIVGASAGVLAQSTLAQPEWGGMGTVSKRWPLVGDWSVVGASEFRLANDFTPILIDFTAIAERGFGGSRKAGGGYLARINKNEVMHRLVQQFTWSGNTRAWKVGHRARLDQNFWADQQAVYRGRYRVTGVRALQGGQVDAGEWYVKVGTEVVQWKFPGEWVSEGRGRLGIGFRGERRGAVELALDYRRSRVKNEAWLNLQVYF